MIAYRDSANEAWAADFRLCGAGGGDGGGGAIFSYPRFDFGSGLCGLPTVWSCRVPPNLHRGASGQAVIMV